MIQEPFKHGRLMCHYTYSILQDEEVSAATNNVNVGKENFFYKYVVGSFIDTSFSLQ